MTEPARPRNDETPAGAGVSRGSPLTDSNRRPLPYHGSGAVTTGPEQPQQRDHDAPNPSEIGPSRQSKRPLNAPSPTAAAPLTADDAKLVLGALAVSVDEPVDQLQDTDLDGAVGRLRDLAAGGVEPVPAAAAAARFRDALYARCRVSWTPDIVDFDPDFEVLKAVLADAGLADDDVVKRWRRRAGIWQREAEIARRSAREALAEEAIEEIGAQLVREGVAFASHAPLEVVRMVLEHVPAPAPLAVGALVTIAADSEAFEYGGDAIAGGWITHVHGNGEVSVKHLCRCEAAPGEQQDGSGWSWGWAEQTIPVADLTPMAGSDLGEIQQQLVTALRRGADGEAGDR